jgi:hypothetical protein
MTIMLVAQKIKVDQFFIGDINTQASYQKDQLKIAKLELTNEFGLLDVKNIELNFAGEKPNVYAAANIAASFSTDQIDLNAITTHGIWGFDDKDNEKRLAMSSAIIDYIGNMRNVVFSGDLNVDQNTQTIAMLEKKLHNPFKNKLSSTFNMKYKKAEHGTFDKSVVDFILTSPDIKVISTSTTDNEDISDHIGLICEIALQ